MGGSCPGHYRPNLLLVVDGYGVFCRVRLLVGLRRGAAPESVSPELVQIKTVLLTALLGDKWLLSPVFESLKGLEGGPGVLLIGSFKRLTSHRLL